MPADAGPCAPGRGPDDLIEFAHDHGHSTSLWPLPARRPLMDRGWRLGGRWYQAVQALPVTEGGQSCGWWLVRRDGEGPRLLLQLWEPLPSPKALDAIREDFLRRFTQGEPLDPGPCHLGYDGKLAWFLQELEGQPFQRVWSEADGPGRDSLVSTVREAMGRSRVPRLLAPEVIGIKPGRILVPRALGTAPWGHDGLAGLAEAAPGRGGAWIWAQQPELVEASGAPIRGRAQELTYLKSLMFGLGSQVPRERVLLLQGEEGLGQDRLCDWAAAAAQSLGIWVASLELRPAEPAGSFMERLVQEAIAGMEADLYAAEPAVAKGLARRMATFAFLRGGRRPGFKERKLEVEEVDAALAALAFAHGRHARLFVIRGLEHLTPELLDLLRGLIGHSKLPWLLSFRGLGGCPGLRPYLESLANHPGTASIILDRLEEAGLPEVLADLLGGQPPPPAFAAAACAASLGNPGLLQALTEMAVHRGELVWTGGTWVCPRGEPALAAGEGQSQSILAGRMDRVLELRDGVLVSAGTPGPGPR